MSLRSDLIEMRMLEDKIANLKNMQTQEAQDKDVVERTCNALASIFANTVNSIVRG